MKKLKINNSQPAEQQPNPKINNIKKPEKVSTPAEDHSLKNHES